MQKLQLLAPRILSFENVSGSIKSDVPLEMKSVENIRFVGFNVASGVGRTSPPGVNMGDSWEKD